MWSAIKTGKYAKAADLPAKETGPKQFGTELWLKFEKTPDASGDKLLQVNVFAWDAKANAWEKEPLATSDRVVWGKGKLWQHTVTLLAAPGSDWREGVGEWQAVAARGEIPREGVRRFRGQGEEGLEGRELGPDEFVGRVEIQARWVKGCTAR